MGLQKIKAMRKAANFRKGIIYNEWEHKKLKMEIEDLKDKLETVQKFKVFTKKYKYKYYYYYFISSRSISMFYRKTRDV